MYSEQMSAWVEAAPANRLEVSTLMMASVVSHSRLISDAWGARLHHHMLQHVGCYQVCALAIQACELQKRMAWKFP